MLSRKILAPAFAMVVLASAAPARAQIYSWRDGNGNLVLSNRPQDAINARQLYAVPKAAAIRVTRAATISRTNQFDDLLVEHARRNDVRADLVRAVVQVESAYNPRARSAKGALGLMQLMPATLQEFGVADPFNPS